MAKQWKSGKNLEGARSAVRVCMCAVFFFFFFLVSVFSCGGPEGGRNCGNGGKLTLTLNNGIRKANI